MSIDTLCGHCEKSIQRSVFCSSCHLLHEKALDFDPFEIFSLEAVVDIDKKKLEADYLDLCRRTHPDFHQKQGTLAAQLTQKLNESYRLLNNDLSRYEYLLKNYGGKDAVNGKESSPSFLLKMLDFQEEIDRCRNCETLEEKQREAHGLYREKLSAAREALLEKNLKKAREALNEVRYCLTLLKHIEDKLDA
jgi:Fe-S protein assembly co-chaperone HscB